MSAFTIVDILSSNPLSANACLHHGGMGGPIKANKQAHYNIIWTPVGSESHENSQM